MEHKEDYFTGLKNLKIFYKFWIPEEPKAIIQILHGGFEHIGRYKYFIERLTSENFIVYGNDHRGHGKSEGKRSHIMSFDEYVEDCYTLTKMIKEKHPNLPFFIVGHSMGSFIAQRYALKYQQELQGLILSGTGTNIMEIPALLRILARVMAKIYPSFKAASNLDPNEISSDPESVADYTNDPLINYKVASAGMGVAFMDHYKEIKPKIGEIQIPVLMQKGELDTMVLGLDELNSDLKPKDKTVKIYKGCKHEMYTEGKNNRDSALSDLVEWLNSHL
ncbi:MAG: alpha/beta hydrolase [Candidatus Heimdallarchaeota archaeon]|nr:alpha/beta hydrolase [Candidatus Heimdallarchaeota archaeon]MCK4770288.1 lysophospholipase [Candidatus Heimdallarchaeota archaeon]